MHITWLKSVHFIFIVSWFSALFYIVRLFIYTAEAQAKEAPAKEILTEQLLLMQRRLWNIIGWPAMIGTLITGWWMLMLNSAYYFSQTWMWLKLAAVALLIVYHLVCQQILMQQAKGLFKYSSFRLRLFNELATVFLVGIVFLVVLKSTTGWLWGILGLLGFAALLMMCVFGYRKLRNDKQ